LQHTRSFVVTTRTLATIPGLEGYVEHAVEVHGRETPGGQDDPAIYVAVWPTAPRPAPRGLAPRQLEPVDEEWATTLAAMVLVALLFGGALLYGVGGVVGLW
jgi:hypothetical protein